MIQDIRCRGVSGGDRENRFVEERGGKWKLFIMGN